MPVTRRRILAHCTRLALAALTGRLLAGSLLPPIERPFEIIIHKGWVFRRTDLCDLRITPAPSDAF